MHESLSSQLPVSKPASLWPPLFADGCYRVLRTSACAALGAGFQIGLPAPSLPRMLIDFEGALAVASANAAIVIVRPTPEVPGTVPPLVSIGALQFGFPPAAPFAYITGTEFWLGGGPPATFVALGSNRVFRMGLSPLPGPGGLVSAQLVCLVTTPVVGPAAGCTSGTTASPALWFSW
jgi:hypothetical protein